MVRKADDTALKTVWRVWRFDFGVGKDEKCGIVNEINRETD